MYTHPVSEEEFRLIQEVRNDETLTQRKLSEKTGIALGTVNAVILLAQAELAPGDRTSDPGFRTWDSAFRTNKYIDVLAAISQN